MQKKRRAFGFTPLGDRKIRCRISELNRSKRACEGDPKACEGTSRGEVRLEFIG